jgi:retron-type reverse transcriptase
MEKYKARLVAKGYIPKRKGKASLILIHLLLD